MRALGGRRLRLQPTWPPGLPEWTPATCDNLRAWLRAGMTPDGLVDRLRELVDMFEMDIQAELRGERLQRRPAEVKR